MFNTLAHAGHAHATMDNMNTIDHCMPIIIGAGVVVLILGGVIAYFLMNWQPKKTTKKATKKTKKS